MKELVTKVTRVYLESTAATEDVVINYGGAGSGKSYSIAQVFEDRFTLWKNRKMLVTRKTLPALKITAEKTLTDMLKEHGIYQKCEHNKTDRIIQYGTNFILFSSTDDPEKRKSEEWTDVWIEEASEFTLADYLMIRTRMRAPADKPRQIFLTLNPVDSNSWIRSETQKPYVKAIHSTYLDNPFVDEAYKQSLESLKDIDENYYNIMALGEWGSHQGIIYPNWQWCDTIPSGDTRRGLDFGYNNESTLVEVTRSGDSIYIQELLYEKNLTADDLRSRMDAIGGKNIETWCDSARPEIIEYLHRNGYNVKPADKSVYDGIMITKAYRTYLTKDSVNIEAERKKYRWKTDKNGTALDEPVKVDDHAMDAIRYCVFSSWKYPEVKFIPVPRETILDSDFRNWQ